MTHYVDISAGKRDLRWNNSRYRPFVEDKNTDFFCFFLNMVVNKWIQDKASFILNEVILFFVCQFCFCLHFHIYSRWEVETAAEVLLFENWWFYRILLDILFKKRKKKSPDVLVSVSVILFSSFVHFWIISCETFINKTSTSIFRYNQITKVH